MFLIFRSFKLNYNILKLKRICIIWCSIDIYTWGGVQNYNTANVDAHWSRKDNQLPEFPNCSSIRIPAYVQSDMQRNFAIPIL